MTVTLPRLEEHPMTTNLRKLGRRQVDVLRAAAKPNGLARFDDGGWAAGSSACTPAAESVARIEPALLVEGDRMALFTLGSGKTRRGVWMGLSTEGERVLQEWELTNAPAVIAHMRRREGIRALAGLTGDALVAGVRDLAAAELGVDDGTFRAVARAGDGQPVIDEPPTRTA